jgi:hypothetical protein
MLVVSLVLFVALGLIVLRLEMLGFVTLKNQQVVDHRMLGTGTH